ncbi:hypothetical protein M8J77_026202 [Diaphorina citri]|nr:hypothetical protein M8J77_026202 [Diaphorina citri]
MVSTRAAHKRSHKKSHTTKNYLLTNRVDREKIVVKSVEHFEAKILQFKIKVQELTGEFQFNLTEMEYENIKPPIQCLMLEIDQLNSNVYKDKKRIKNLKDALNKLFRQVEYCSPFKKMEDHENLVKTPAVDQRSTNGSEQPLLTSYTTTTQNNVSLFEETKGECEMISDTPLLVRVTNESRSTPNESQVETMKDTQPAENQLQDLPHSVESQFLQINEHNPREDRDSQKTCFQFQDIQRVLQSAVHDKPEQEFEFNIDKLSSSQGKAERMIGDEPLNEIENVEDDESDCTEFELSFHKEQDTCIDIKQTDERTNNASLKCDQTDVQYPNKSHQEESVRGPSTTETNEVSQNEVKIKYHPMPQESYVANEMVSDDNEEFIVPLDSNVCLQDDYLNSQSLLQPHKTDSTDITNQNDFLLRTPPKYTKPDIHSSSQSPLLLKSKIAVETIFQEAQNNKTIEAQIMTMPNSDSESSSPFKIPPNPRNSTKHHLSKDETSPGQANDDWFIKSLKTLPKKPFKTLPDYISNIQEENSKSQKGRNVPLHNNINMRSKCESMSVPRIERNEVTNRTLPDKNDNNMIRTTIEVSKFEVFPKDSPRTVDNEPEVNIEDSSTTSQCNSLNVYHTLAYVSDQLRKRTGNPYLAKIRTTNTPTKNINHSFTNSQSSNTPYNTPCSTKYSQMRGQILSSSQINTFLSDSQVEDINKSSQLPNTGNEKAIISNQYKPLKISDIRAIRKPVYFTPDPDNLNATNWTPEDLRLFF